MRLGIGFFFQAEDGIRDLVRSRGLGDVYKRQATTGHRHRWSGTRPQKRCGPAVSVQARRPGRAGSWLLYTSDAAGARSSVDLGGRRLIKKKNQKKTNKSPSTFNK